MTHQCLNLDTSLFPTLLRILREDVEFSIWYLQNLLDVWITKIVIGTGKAIELNLLVNVLGGPFALPSLALKTLIAPGIAYFLYRVIRRSWGKSLGIRIMAVMNVMYVAILTNNFVVFNQIVR